MPKAEGQSSYEKKTEANPRAWMSLLQKLAESFTLLSKMVPEITTIAPKIGYHSYFFNKLLDCPRHKTCTFWNIEL